MSRPRREASVGLRRVGRGLLGHRKITPVKAGRGALGHRKIVPVKAGRGALGRRWIAPAKAGRGVLQHLRIASAKAARRPGDEAYHQLNAGETVYSLTIS